MEAIVKSMRSEFKEGISKEGNPYKIDKKFFVFEVKNNSPIFKNEVKKRASFGPEYVHFELKNDFDNLVYVRGELPVGTFFDLEGCHVILHLNSNDMKKLDCIEVVSIDGVQFVEE